MLATTNVEFIVPVQTARLCSGMTVVKSIRPPANIPDAPSPVTTLPAMRAFDVGDKAQTKLPASKSARYAKYTVRFGKRVNAFPASGVVEQLAEKY